MKKVPYIRLSRSVILFGLAAATTLGFAAARAQPASRLASVDSASAKQATPQSQAAPAEPTLHNDSVAAIINDDVITDYDLRQRAALFMTTSGMQPTPEAMAKLKPQLLEQLQTEKLELQEAQRKKITVSQAEVDKQIDSILSENHLTMDQLKSTLDKGGVAIGTLRSQLAAQIAWQKAVQDEFADRINISTTDVDEELARLNEGKDKPRFLVAEIFLAVDNPDQDAKVLKDAQNIEAQLQMGAPFAALARQFSQSPSAAQGGDMGVVPEGQLAPELNDALVKMTPGSVSQPIRSVGGYYILGLRERLEPPGTKVPEAAAQTTKPSALPLARLLLPMPPKAPKPYFEAAEKAAAEIRQHIANCEMLPKLAQQVKGAVYMNLGQMRLADLSAEIRDALDKTQPGETTEPFISSAGVELIVRCDRAAPKIEVWQQPTREEVEQQLFGDQISMYARRYMRDLRRNADIQTR